MSNKIMAWVDLLPQVEATDFQARRDQIAATVTEAVELLEAGEVKKAEGKRAEAYFAALKLEGDAKGHWTIQQVEQAKAAGS